MHNHIQMTLRRKEIEKISIEDSSRSTLIKVFSGAIKMPEENADCRKTVGMNTELFLTIRTSVAPSITMVYVSEVMTVTFLITFNAKNRQN